jgi:hypothetical protein
MTLIEKLKSWAQLLKMDVLLLREIRDSLKLKK